MHGFNDQCKRDCKTFAGRDVCLQDLLLRVQGAVDSRVLEDANEQTYMLVLCSRRSRLHPGTRYIARGLNSLASPGNEIECEQVCKLF